MTTPPVSRIALYVRDMPKIAAFYRRHFGFEETPSNGEGKLILTQPGGRFHLVLLQASKGHRPGQSAVKIIFDVPDVPRNREEQARIGLKFGPVHRGPNYAFANARDPAKNLIQISSGYLVDPA